MDVLKVRAELLEAIVMTKLLAMSVAHAINIVFIDRARVLQEASIYSYGLNKGKECKHP